MSRIDEIDRNHTKEEMYAIGKEFLDGSCATAMPTTAIKYFVKAAERGHIQAQYELGCMYEKGIGSEVDIEKAIEWYSGAASHDYPQAKEALERISR